MADALSVIPPAVLRNLSDKLYEKRKNAALEIEGIVKQLAAAGEHDKITAVINLLANEFTYSAQVNHRKGGLIGLATATVALTGEAAQHLEVVSRALVENARTLRLPTYLHERLSLIRNAKTKHEEEGIAPPIDRIAACMNMSQTKVRNATEAISKVFSLDREAFPSLNVLPGETLHSYFADNHLENNPWHGVDEWALKDEVNKLISTTLRERERVIIRLYYGLDSECLTWEDISRRWVLLNTIHDISQVAKYADDI
ncbi:RNA polymerase sigma factor sigA-like isoform X1 [Camellia sinensis]|uniref:RNA polymerase sigma factor sigA-like isoform X1 n=1 Tax=Camellia sinensis TaxID=4442 RepID=UPI001036D923|nr:RNA polymerase sigma factor sigA-like isoform X1 [Camellia sinensis]